jgi:hypothetical protein
VVPPRSDRISRVPPYSRTALGIYPYGAVTRYGRSFQIVPVFLEAATGLVRVRSPLLAESLLMSFPPGTKMFQFPGLASNPLCIQGSDTSYQMTDLRRRPQEDPVSRRLISDIWKWVAPFGYPRIKACSQLPTAFRSVPRPS